MSQMKHHCGEICSSRLELSVNAVIIIIVIIIIVIIISQWFFLCSPDLSSYYLLYILINMFMINSS